MYMYQSIYLQTHLVVVASDLTAVNKMSTKSNLEDVSGTHLRNSLNAQKTTTEHLCVTEEVIGLCQEKIEDRK